LAGLVRVGVGVRVRVWGRVRVGRPGEGWCSG